MAVDGALNIWIGFDGREPSCSYVAAHSIHQRTNAKLNIQYLKHRELRKKGLFKRLWITENDNGENIDVVDGRTFSTEFSHTRFLVPALMEYNGWALFLDADMLFLSDVKKLFALCDERYAAMCVKHVYPPAKDSLKMDGRAQRVYARKNWSSFVLWNCGHTANKYLTPEMVNFLHGRDLHAFSWLSDELIGEIPPSYNFISGISPKLSAEKNGRPDVIHYSNGGPWFEECVDVPYAQLWIDEFESWQANGEGNKYSEIPTLRYDK